MADLTSKLDGQGSTKLSGLALALPLLYDHDGFSATVDRFKDKLTPLLDLTNSGRHDVVWMKQDKVGEGGRGTFAHGFETVCKCLC